MKVPFSPRNPMTKCPVCGKQLSSFNNMAFCSGTDHYDETWFVRDGSLSRRITISGRPVVEYNPFEASNSELKKIEKDIEKAVQKAMTYGVKFKK